MSEIPVFQSDFCEISRRNRHLLARLRLPARVLSTCPVNGGLRGDLTALVNHQSCEPAKHGERFEVITGLGQAGYHALVCGELALDPRSTAVLGTAAQMQYLGVASHQHADLEVTAVVTAGVTGNAGCAGDPASYDEANGTWTRTGPSPANPDKAAGTQNGTINTLLLFSSPLNDAGLARTIMTMTEAKTSALQELAIGSRSSWRLATGTGTDQFALAAPCEGKVLRSWTGKHTKAGELIGKAVREATLEALRWQNGLERSYTRSLFHALGRFGLTEERFKEEIGGHLSENEHRLLQHNWNPVIYEPQTAAAAYGFAAVLDRCLCGTLGASSAQEALLHQAALLACGLAAQPECFPKYRSELAKGFLPLKANAPETLLAPCCLLIVKALALGWQDKWAQPDPR